MKIFIDSDAFLALLNQSDSLHRQAVRLLKQLQQSRDVTYLTSWDVIDEVATKTSFRMTRKQAIDFLRYIKQVGTIVVYPDAKLAKKAQALFAKISSKKVSMTDCMSMIIIDQMKLDAVFSFDKHFTQQGYALLKDVLDL